MTYYSRAPSLKQMERGEENNIVMQHTRSESYNVSKVTYWRHVEDQTYHSNLYKTRVPTHRWQYQQDRHCTYVEANTVVRSYNHCCCGKAISITQRECVCVCVCSLRYPERNAQAPYCHVACPALQYFSTFSHKWHDFRKTLLNVKCVF